MGTQSLWQAGPAIVLLLLLQCFGGANVAHAAEAAIVADGDYVVQLMAALRRPMVVGDALLCDLTLRLSREAGQWNVDVYGTADTYNHGLHPGVMRVREADQSLHLEIDLTLQRISNGYGEQAGPEGRARYVVALRRGGDGRWVGDYSGKFEETQRGQLLAEGLKYEIRGAAALSRDEGWPGVGADHKPVPPGAHPRLFFGKDDLEMLRARARTARGKVFVARMEALLKRNHGGFAWNRDGSAGQPYTEGTHAAGHAFMYALTGQAAHAERAKWLAFRAMAANGGEWGSWGNGLRIPGVAVAYDLCYDAWKQSDPDFLRQTAEWLQAAARGRGTSPDRHFDGFFHCAGGLAALAVLNDPIPKPAAPTNPDDAKLLSAARDYNPPQGVPVFDFVDGQLSKNWLVAGGFNPGYGGEPLAHYGGRAKARPEAGARFRQGEVDFEWVARTTDAPRIELYGFSANPRKKGEPRRVFESDGAMPSMVYFYAVLKNDRPRVVKAAPRAWGAFHGPDMPIPGVRLWLNGKELNNDDVVRLEAGLYPVLLELTYANQMLIEPKLVEYTAERYAADMAAYQEELDAWQRAGGTMPHAAARARHMAHFVSRYADLCYGERGFFTEDSTQADAIYNLLPFVYAYRNVTGRDLSAAQPHLREILPLIILTRHRFLRHDWGIQHFKLMGFPTAVSDPRYLAVLRHEIDQLIDHADTGDSASGLISLPWDGMFALLNYPWDVPPKSRQEAKPPAVVADGKFGGYVFTNNPGGAGGKPEYQAIVLLQHNAPRSSVTAGDVSILVDGELWSGYGNAGGGFFRPACLTAVEQPSVLRIDGAIPTRGASLVALDLLGPDGTQGGVVTMVQDYWVAGSADQPHGSPKVLHPASLGITATRSVAVDFSGKSGSPMVVVVADRVRGAGERAAWVQYRFTEADARDALKLVDNHFTIAGRAPRDPQTSRENKAAAPTLVGTVILPKRSTIEHRGRMVEIAASRMPPHFRAAMTGPALDEVTSTSAPQRKPDGPEDVLAQLDTRLPVQPARVCPAVDVGGDELFITIFTMQPRGCKTPAVEVTEEHGTAVKWKVGDRAFEFDGERIKCP